MIASPLLPMEKNLLKKPGAGATKKGRMPRDLSFLKASSFDDATTIPSWRSLELSRYANWNFTSSF